MGTFSFISSAYPRYQKLRHFFRTQSAPPIMLATTKRFARTILPTLQSQHFQIVRGILVGLELPLSATVTVIQAQEAQIAAEKDENGGPVPTGAHAARLV
jgi:hypothetical protein